MLRKDLRSRALRLGGGGCLDDLGIEQQGGRFKHFVTYVRYLGVT
jgi:hypothetical protein